MEEEREKYINTEFGKVPSDWRYCTFKDVLITFSSGATPYRAIAEYYKGKIRWISSGELNYNVIYDTSEHISEAALKNTNLKIHEPGTFLMAITGLEAEGTRGRCAIIGAPSTTNQSCLALNGTGKMTTDYLFWFYRQYGNYLAFKYCQGTKQQSYTAAIVKKLPICCPEDPHEQIAIATALSDTDALIAALDKKIAKKRQIKQGAMQQLLTGKKRLLGFSENNKYKQTDIGLIPEDWEVINLGDISKYQGGSQPDISFFSARQYNGFIRLVQIRDYKTDKYAVYIPENLARRKCTTDDIMIGRYGPPIFQILKGLEGAYNVALIKAISNHNVDKSFFYYTLKREDLFQLIELLSRRSSGQTGVDLVGLKSFKIGLPPKAEQTAIAQILTDMDHEIAHLEKERDKYVQLKAGMMQVLLTGKVRLVNESAKDEHHVISLVCNEKKVNHNEKFNEAVIISFLVNKFGSDAYPLSRFRYTKFAYLLHRQIEQVAKGFNKHAAGPYKSDNRYKGPEKIAIDSRYITKVENSKSGKDAFIANTNIIQAINYFNEWYGFDVQEWIEQFRFYKNDDLEVLTTVDESICDLDANCTEISVKEIKSYIASIPQWKHKLTKSCFSDLNIERMIRKIKELSLQ